MKDIRSPSAEKPISLLYQLCVILTKSKPEIFNDWFSPLTSLLRPAIEALLKILSTIPTLWKISLDVEYQINQSNDVQKIGLTNFYNKVQMYIEKLVLKIKEIDAFIDFLGNDSGDHPRLSNDQKVREIRSGWNEVAKGLPRELLDRTEGFCKRDVARYSFFYNLNQFFNDMKAIKAQVEEDDYKERIRKRREQNVRRKQTETENLKIIIKATVESPQPPSPIVVEPTSGPREATRRPTLRPQATLQNPTAANITTAIPASRRLTRKGTVNTNQPTNPTTGLPRNFLQPTTTTNPGSRSILRKPTWMKQ